jgi:hypothetical protein
LQGRHPRANRRTLIDPIPTVLSQVTAACPVFIASSDSALTTGLLLIVLVENRSDPVDHLVGKRWQFINPRT